MFSNVSNSAYSGIMTSQRSAIFGGILNRMEDTVDSSVFGGSYNCINYNSCNNNILSGYSNKISYHSCNNSVISGNNNSITCYSGNVIMGGGLFNTITCYSSGSSMFGGEMNSIGNYSCNSSIISSKNSSIDNSNGSVILGGCNLTLNSQDDVVMVPKLISNCGLLTGTISNTNRVEWKLGSTVSSFGLSPSISMDINQYIEVSLDGVTYKLALIQ